MSDGPNLYDSLVALLGKTPDDQSFGALIQMLGEEPLVNSMEHVDFYDFPNTGVQILFERIRVESEWVGQKRFSVIIFFLTVISKYLKSYNGDLAAGITPADSRQVVARKLHLKRNQGLSSADNVDIYVLESYTLQFTFDSETKEMALVMAYLERP